MMNEEPQNPYEAPQAQTDRPLEDQPTGPVDAVFKRFFRLIGDEGGPALYLWGIICVANLPAQLLNITAQQQMLRNPLSGFGMVAVIYALSFVVGILTVTAWRVLKLSEERGGDVSFSEGISVMLERVIPTGGALILYGLATGIGMVFCLVPGIIALFIFAMAPFICAVYEVSPVDSMKMSFEWLKAHATIFVVWMVGGFIYAMIVGGIAMGVMFAMGGGAMMQTGTLDYIPTIVIWLLTSFGGYFMWVFSGSVMLTMGRAEEVYMQRPDPFR